MSAKIRVMKELRALERDSTALPNVDVVLTDNVHLLYADIHVHGNAIYNDKYRVEMTLPDDYPFAAPVCLFIKTETTGIPMHPHVYSNGHICLDILGSEWTPVQTIQSVLLSLHSFLASNTRNERPPDDESYVKHAPKNPKNAKFVYHDDDV